ncbi:MAG TPA: hypothetical protein VLX92_31685 [Kofleriaceae bacterium]|nr:hypothetical protein [Kofleriaceae bacterium]
MRRLAASSLVLAPALLAAAGGLPNGADAVEAQAMAGPFATLDDACTSAGLDHDACSGAAAVRPCGPTTGAGHLTGAFAEARVVPGCDVALRTAKGWYTISTEGLPAWAGFLNNGDRYRSQITSIAKSRDGKAILIDGVFVHGTDAAKMRWLAAPPSDDWYECEERLFVCAIGDAGPSCAGPFPVAYTAYCRDGEHPDRALHRREPHDFRFAPALDGTTLTLRATRRDQPRSAPLPGWAVVAIDAERLEDVTRDLSPERVELSFP